MNENDVKVNVKKRPPVSNSTIASRLEALGYHFKKNLVTARREIKVDGKWKDLDDDTWAFIFGVARMQYELGPDLAKENIVRMAIYERAAQNAYHPVKDYLNACMKKQTDFTRPTINAFIDAFQVSPADEYARDIFIEKWLCGCIGRVFHDFNNYMLIVSGPQWIGKSHAIKALCRGISDYYTEEDINISDKDSSLRLASSFVWTVEEFGSVLKSSNRNAVKAFITKGASNVRASYDRYTEKRPRLASLVGTTNENEILTDPTGNRRYLVIKPNSIDLDAINNLDMDMLWGEVMQMVKELGVDAYYLTDSEKALQKEVNTKAELIDPVEELLSSLIEPCSIGKVLPGRAIWSSDLITRVNQSGLVSSTYAPNKVADMMKKLGYGKIKRMNRWQWTGCQWRTEHIPKFSLVRDSVAKDDEETNKYPF